MINKYEGLSYFEKKKREGLIFTQHNMNISKPYNSMEKDRNPVISNYSFWSRLSGRYRTYEEQVEYIRSRYKDKALPKLSY